MGHGRVLGRQLCTLWSVLWSAEVTVVGELFDDDDDDAIDKEKVENVYQNNLLL